MFGASSLPKNDLHFIEWLFRSFRKATIIQNIPQRKDKRWCCCQARQPVCVKCTQLCTSVVTSTITITKVCYCLLGVCYYSLASPHISHSIVMYSGNLFKLKDYFLLLLLLLSVNTCYYYILVNMHSKNAFGISKNWNQSTIAIVQTQYTSHTYTMLLCGFVFVYFWRVRKIGQMGQFHFLNTSYCSRGNKHCHSAWWMFESV